MVIYQGLLVLHRIDPLPTTLLTNVSIVSFVTDTKQAKRTVRCAAVCVALVTSFTQDDDDDDSDQQHQRPDNNTSDYYHFLFVALYVAAYRCIYSNSSSNSITRENTTVYRF